MTQKTSLLAIIIAMFAISCEMVGFEKTKSGLSYKIFPGANSKDAAKKGDTLRPGTIVKFNYKLTYNDSVLGSSYETIPGYDMVDSNPRFHDFAEVLTKLRIGDSLVTYQYYDTLAKQNPAQMPPFLKKGSKIKMTIKILDTIANGMAGVQEDVMKEEEGVFKRESARIEKYIAVKKLNVKKVNNVYIEVISEGTGLAADSGKYVGVNYSGYTLEGKYFDSNTDTTKQEQKHPLETFYCWSKQSGAIPGMLEGISHFKEGGKGRLIIPSSMAYGRQGGGAVIKPYEPLVFDIEIVKVKDSTMPGMDMSQFQPGN